jgi:hypothetical protein
MSGPNREEYRKLHNDVPKVPATLPLSAICTVELLQVYLAPSVFTVDSSHLNRSLQLNRACH